MRFAWAALFFSISAAASPRLVSTSPGLTELLFQLGHGADIVGTSVMSWYPDEAKKIPTIGSEFMPGAERIARFAPDWVLFDTAVHSPTLSRALNVLRYPSAQLLITSPDTLLDESARLMRMIYPGENDARLAAYRRCLAIMPKPARTHRFLALAWLSPPFIFGAHTFLNSLIRRLGGVNVAPDTWSVEYPQVTEEWLLRQKVDVVYFTPEDPDASKQLEKLGEKWWPGRHPTLRRLPPEFFARATFTPFRHLKMLNPDLDYSSLEACLGAIR